MQPDFLFTALRGSHEKMTYCLLLAALLLLFRSYRHRNRLSAFAGYVGLFYVALAAVICTNSTFGSSLVVAISASFFGGFFVSRIFQPGKVTTNRILLRLAYASSSSFLVLYLVLFYFYPPSQAIFDQFQTAMARIAALALSFEATDHPYSYIAIGWRSPLIYLMLTAFTWVVLATSGLAWLRQTVTMLRDGWAMAPAHARLRWLLYAGLALQVGIGVLADFSGVLGSNLQLRLFPVFMFLAIPTASLAVVDVLKRLDGRPALRTAARLTLSVFAVCFGAFSVLKATNEPLLSNKWVFYSTPEAQTLDWLQVHMPSTPVWTDVDERLREVYLFRSPPTEDASVRFPTNKPADQLPVVMLSQITRDRLAQMRIPEPDLLRTDVVYDNGLVKLYRYPPRTPLQR